MPTLDVAAVRTALATALASVDGLEVSAYVPDTVDPPWAYLVPGEGQYDLDMDGGWRVDVAVRVVTSRAEDRAGQATLDGLLDSTGAGSIKAALEADPTLGGLVDDLAVRGWSGYRLYEIAGTDYYGAELLVEVYA